MHSAGQSLSSAIRACANEVARHVNANNGNPMAAKEEIIAAIAALLKRPDLLEAGLNRPAVNADSSKILYYDPGLMFVMGYSKGEGRYDPPHNHGNWIATAVYRGEVEYKDYKRIDDLSRSGYAELEMTAQGVLKAGDVALTPGPPHDIHSNTMLTENYTMVVIGGGFASKRLYYNPEERSYVERVTS